MNLGSIKTVAALALVAAVVVPSVIFGTSAADALFEDEEPDLTIEAADGPNGEYVEVVDGDVELDLTGRTNAGINAEATTRIDHVFTITNADAQQRRVWVDDEGTRSDVVTLTDSETGDGIEGNTGAVVLAPGDRLRVGLVVDTTSIDTAQHLIQTVSVNTRVYRSDSTERATPTATATPTPTPTPNQNATTSVIFDDGGSPSNGSDGQVRITQLSMEELEQLDAEAGDLGTDAIISSDTDDGADDIDVGSSADAAGDVSAAGDRVLTKVNERVRLSGERSTVGTTDSIQAEQITEAVDIGVPEDRQDEPATVQIRVGLDNVSEDSLDEVQIGHRTERGWQLLETSVAERTDEAIVFEARTFGFSPFAVFVSPGVEYTWTLPDGTTITGSEFDYAFEEPGIYDVTLTVTDALGRSDTETRTIIANDEVTATIGVGDRNETTGNVTLSAAVENEVGNTTVTWTFPDGTTQVGTVANHSFGEGQHTVGLRVEDEYGEVFETEKSIEIGTGGFVEQLDELPSPMTMGSVVAFSLLALGIAGSFYRYGPHTLRLMIRSMDRGPNITEVGEPGADLANGRLGLSRLEVLRGGADLETISIELVDDNGTVEIRKEQDTEGESEYRAAPEEMLIPPGTGLDPERAYAIRITAIDERGRHDEEYSRQFRLPAHPEGDHSGESGGETVA